VNDLQADISWFAVFRAMFLQGTVAEIGCSAFGVWACIRAHCDFQTGLSIPPEDEIAKQTGLSRRQVVTSLQVLQQKGLLEKRKEWKRNVYYLKEKLILEDDDGMARAIATWTHIPSALKKARQELHNFLLTGSDKDAKVIHIEKLVIENLVIGEQVNINGIAADLDSIKDQKLREQMRKLLMRRNCT
jgi:hypothetical protein